MEKKGFPRFRRIREVSRMSQDEKYYALELLRMAGEKAVAAVAEMATLRKNLADCMDTDRNRARTIHSTLKRQKEELIKNLSDLPLPLLEVGMDELSQYTQKLISSVKIFQIMTPSYDKLECVIQNLISKLPQNNQTVNAAVIGRLMNRVKMGYYPTDMEHLAHIKRSIVFPEQSVNLFDPCCGKGLALATLGEGENCQTYGVEIDDSRAEIALSKLTRVGFGSYFYARISKQAFHAMLLNPPYLSMISPYGGNFRTEKRFLAECIPHLMVGGLLVYIIPHYRLTKDICKALCENFRDITIWKFYGAEYERFRQIAVFGIRKERCEDEDEQLQASVMDMDAVPELSEIPDGRYVLPEQEKKVAVFQGAKFNQAELARQLASSQRFTQIFSKSRMDELEKRPLLPLSIGQIGLIGGSGLINGLVDCGAPHIIKGRIVKEVRTRQEDNQDAVGGPTKTLYVTNVNKMIFNVLTPEGFRSLS